MNELDGEKFHVDNNTALLQWSHNSNSLPSLIRELAVKHGMPFDHVIDSEKCLLGDDKKPWLDKKRYEDFMADAIHPSEKGYGMLAQEIYNRMAYSNSYLKRQNLN